MNFCPFQFEDEDKKEVTLEKVLLKGHNKVKIFKCFTLLEGVEVEAKSLQGTLQFLNFLVEGYTSQNLS